MWHALSMDLTVFTYTLTRFYMNYGINRILDFAVPAAEGIVLINQSGRDGRLSWPRVRLEIFVRGVRLGIFFTHQASTATANIRHKAYIKTSVTTDGITRAYIHTCWYGDQSERRPW